MKKSILALILAFSLTATPAYAHVVVKPSEAKPASYQTFTVSVPNERDNPTVQVSLVIPNSIQSVTPTVKPGWQIVTEKSGEGEAAQTTRITWQGGEIGPELRDDFTFSAKTPAGSEKITWKSYQTYSDGTVVSWDKSGNDPTESVTSGPFSTTIVTNDITPTVDKETTDNSSTNATVNRAFYISVASLVVALGAVFIVSRSKDRK